MQPFPTKVARSLISVFLRVCHTGELYKMAEPIEMQFGEGSFRVT